MKNANPAVDKYIDDAAQFARPILIRLRKLFHKACPDVEETIKWQRPHFEYQGVLASMAAFKQHVRFGFWKQSLMADPAGPIRKAGSTPRSMSKITSVEQLPSDKVLIASIKEAVRLNIDGVKAARPKSKKPRPAIDIPEYFATALKKNRAARETFENFSPSHQREYLEWLTEAKQEETRQKRLATTLEWLAEGKSRNWKYQDCKS